MCVSGRGYKGMCLATCSACSLIAVLHNYFYSTIICTGTTYIHVYIYNVLSTQKVGKNLLNQQVHGNRYIYYTVNGYTYYAYRYTA